ncbi:hypothetical protein ILYODFUR_020376 [Ilyodon furcidens]|uniref:Uncharacterized protein n=1 Tax=Ilyodon furcidens TaxID=33524 RepID=A0ABV0V4P5_9TELE
MCLNKEVSLMCFKMKLEEARRGEKLKETVFYMSMLLSGNDRGLDISQLVCVHEFLGSSAHALAPIHTITLAQLNSQILPRDKQFLLKPDGGAGLYIDYQKRRRRNIIK